MSKMTTRVALSALISLGVIIGLYTTVLGASPNTAGNRMGNHLVSGAKVNLDHYRTAEVQRNTVEIQPYFHSSKGRGCENEWTTSLDD